MIVKPYVQTITTTTTGESTVLPTGLKLLKITNDDATNFTTISFNAAIGTADNPEGVLLAGAPVDFTNSAQLIGTPIEGMTLHSKSDTADVNITIVGYIS